MSDFLPRAPYDSNRLPADIWKQFISRYGGKNNNTRKNADGFIPAIYHGSLEDGLAHDTYIDTQGWGKGYLNVKYDDWFNLGRSVLFTLLIYTVLIRGSSFICQIYYAIDLTLTSLLWHGAKSQS